MNYFVGLDVSLEETSICVVNDSGVIVWEGKAETDPGAIETWLTALNTAFERAGLEAGPLSPWLCEGLQAAGLPAVCIDTRRMKGGTAAMAVKTDRNDARAIAQAMRVGVVHAGARQDDGKPGVALASDQPQDTAYRPCGAGKRKSAILSRHSA